MWDGGQGGEDPEALAPRGGLHLGRMELRCRCRWGHDSGDWDLGNGNDGLVGGVGRA